MRTRALTQLQYQVGDVAPAFNVRFDDSLIDPTELGLGFRLATWFGDVVQCDGDAELVGEVATRTDAASGLSYFSFTLGYEWVTGDLDTAGLFYAQFILDPDIEDASRAVLPADRSLKVSVHLAAVTEGG